MLGQVTAFLRRLCVVEIYRMQECVRHCSIRTELGSGQPENTVARALGSAVPIVRRPATSEREVKATTTRMVHCELSKARDAPFAALLPVREPQSDTITALL